MLSYTLVVSYFFQKYDLLFIQMLKGEGGMSLTFRLSKIKKEFWGLLLFVLLYAYICILFNFVLLFVSIVCLWLFYLNSLFSEILYLLYSPSSQTGLKRDLCNSSLSYLLCPQDECEIGMS